MMYFVIYSCLGFDGMLSYVVLHILFIGKLVGAMLGNSRFDRHFTAETASAPEDNNIAAAHGKCQIITKSASPPYKD
jgi:hypothetical protein